MIKSSRHGENPCELAENLERCNCCGGQMIKDFERGQHVCKDCGTVTDYPVMSPECESSFLQGTDAGRGYVTAIYNSGPPTTLAFHDLGISSEIGGGFRDAKGKAISGKARYRAILLRKWHSRTRTKDYRDLNVAKALSSLNDLADRLALPLYVREDACALYRKVAEKRLTIGRSISALAGVSLYVAIRRARLPLMLRDILPVLGLGQSEFNGYLNTMKRETGVDVPPADPVAWIPRIAAECHYSCESQVRAVKFIRDMVRLGQAFGMLPHVIAAIALYRMSAMNGEKRAITDVAKAARCAPNSIQKGLTESPMH